MRRRPLPLTLSLVFALLAPVWAQPQPGDGERLPGPDGQRPPGSRTRTADEAKRYYTGPDELQPAIGRPAGHQPLTPEQAAKVLAALRADLVAERSLESLLPGLEDYRAVIGRVDAAIGASGGTMRAETLGEVYGLPVKAIHLGGPPAGTAPGFRPKVLILGGVHSGTEKTGFEAATRFLELAARDPSIRARFDITVIPLVNPTALVLGTRENAKGIDINRTFVEGKLTPESKVLYDYLRGRRYDLSLDLHTAGDPGRDGFFLIRGKQDGGLGARAMQALPSAALLDAPGKPGEARVGPYVLYGVGLSEIESIRGTTMDLLVEAGTPYVYTFEAPTRMDPKVQVDLTLRFLGSALNNALKFGRFERVEKPAEKPAEENPAEEKLPEEKVTVAEVDPKKLSPYRRPDGTLDWKRLSADRVLPEVGGLAHFGLALFLKEVAVVAATGDRARIEEFFDSLLTTDFYRQYGLFVAGARLGEVAYARALERYVRPRFVNGLLKTNIALAAGLALPSLVDGTFSGRAFALSLGSLGLSTAAVRGGVAGIRWVYDLSKAREAGLLTRVGLSRAARVGGWFYTVAELAVVLYVADAIEAEVDQRLALAEARGEVAAASRRLIAAAADPRATSQSLEAAARDHAAAWAAYRNFLYAPLHQDEAQLAHRLEKLSTRAKLLEDEQRAALARIALQPALRRSVEARYGSLAAYAAARAREAEESLQRDVDAALASYERARSAHFLAVYREGRRDGELLAGVPDLDWQLAGAAPGGVGDPYGARGDVFARWGRDRASSALTSALEGASTNRLQSYEDEREVLGALASSLRARGRQDLAPAIDAASGRARTLAEADRKLVEGLSARVGATTRSE
ncbi:MAG: succinylglutamate desuccinylase/aspartoacylase family protein [Planctomycetota bacterium]